MREGNRESGNPTFLTRFGEAHLADAETRSGTRHVYLGRLTKRRPDWLAWLGPDLGPTQFLCGSRKIPGTYRSVYRLYTLICFAMEDRFRGISTRLRDGNPYWQKVRILYNDPDTGCKRRVTVSYVRNDDILTALENTLLQFIPVDFTQMTYKAETVAQLAHSGLTTLSPNLYRTVTGLEFRTDTNGELFWHVFEDLDEVVNHISVERIPALVPKINISEICDFKCLRGPVHTVEYRGTKYAFKAHDVASQNKIFPAELFARIKIGDVPHVTNFDGVVTSTVQPEGVPYVAGILMNYYAQGNLRWLLRKAEASVEWEIKWKWACQIAHGMVEIHRAGAMHGDLRCENIVIDDKGNAFIIDIVDGRGCMEGWTSIYDEQDDPRCDVYALGVTLWEIASDGKDPVHPLTSVGMDDIDIIIRQCVIDNASERATLDHILTMIAEKGTCGCPRSDFK